MINNMFTPSLDEFLKLSAKGNLIPIYQETSGDLDTPVSAYFKISQKSKYSFLLESVEGEAKVARFSFLANNPELVLQSKNNEVTLHHLNGTKAKKEHFRATKTQNPLHFLRNILKKYTFVKIPGLPRFCGGAVGFMSYDIVRHFERIPEKTKDDLNIPDMMMVLSKDMIIFDHLHHTIKTVHCTEVGPKLNKNAKTALYKKACKRIETLTNTLKKPLTASKNNARPKGKKSVQLSFQSNFTKAQFEGIIESAKEDIRSGEIIQVVLSQRFSTPLKTDGFNVYRCLRGLNPSPYMYYLNLDDIQIIGSSPELLVRCEDGIVETRPIAGTRPRGKDEKEDAALAKDLLADPKEKAEHIMLVDLGRNDLGRVCEEGTVKVSEFMAIEKYSHVMHIISNVRGRLNKSKDHFDVLEAAFPAGTVSGAPKIRAMEIIERLEKQRRGPYAGCIAYFSFSGNLDSCITIRTIVVKNNKAYIQAGAGIVADSNPASEYQETLNKACAQLLAIERAQG